MKKRIIGFLDEFFEPGTVLGRVVANEGFLSALLRLDPFDEYRFYLHNPNTMREIIKKLPYEGCRHCTVLSRLELVQDLRTVPFFSFHLNDPLSSQTKLAVLRNHYAQEIFPITSVPHTISYTEYAQEFLNEIWAGTSPRDCICATSHVAIQTLNAYFETLRANYMLPESWNPPSLRLLPLGVDCTKWRPAGEEEKKKHREKWGIGKGTVLSLLHGRIACDDKMDLLPFLYAVKRILNEENPPDMHFIISGFVRENDKYPDSLKAQAKNLGIPFDLITHPSDEDVYSLYCASDIFLSPSDNIQETFGLTVLEAGAMGLPTIVSDWDGYRDLVVEGETGFRIASFGPKKTPDLDAFAFLLPDNIHGLLRCEQTAIDIPLLSSRLSYLARNEKARLQMGQAARKHIETKYAWESIIRQWVALLEDLWALPLSAQEEKRLREAMHPTFLPIANIFSHHPTEVIDTVESEKKIHLSEHGRKILEKKDFALCWPQLRVWMKEIDHRQIMVLCRKAISFKALFQKLHCSDIETEAVQFVVLWMLKHDILEFVRDDSSED